MKLSLCPYPAVGLVSDVGVTAILINVRRAVLLLDIHAARADRRTDAVGVD